MTIRFGFSLTGRGALADREAITALAQRADALGYDSVFVTDRMLIPVTATASYPYSPTGAFPLGPDEPWLEALTAVTYLATVTRRIQVGTSVLVIPYRNPVFTARALATADYLSGGRVILGAGIGWWREEFQTLGVPFEDRAARTVEALRLMREIWTRPRIEFEGRFWQVREAGGTRPYPVQQPHIPIWIGGHSDAALRRVVEIADGWHPLGLRPPVRLDPDELAGRAQRLAEFAHQARRDPADIVIAFKAPFGFRKGAGRDRTPLSGSPAQLVEDLQAYVAVGVRHFVLDFTVPTPPEMLEAMERFATDVRPHVHKA
ncbi:MAG TPA: LLM class F420-dependent oxidoreductase [Methylomirabilota bacterium]|jgi:probable F420-dependent oxidoreductase|nr:LLM class F420-dependent oxidoreductase [Methylomirabilota bacterium]